MSNLTRYALSLFLCALGGASAAAGEGIAKIRTEIRGRELTRLVAPGEWVPYG